MSQSSPPPRRRSPKRPYRSHRAEIFDEWWPRAKDVGSFVVGIVLVLLDGLSLTQRMIGVALLGVAASGVAGRILERIAANGNGKRE